MAPAHASVSKLPGGQNVRININGKDEAATAFQHPQGKLAGVAITLPGASGIGHGWAVIGDKLK